MDLGRLRRSLWRARASLHPDLQLRSRGGSAADGDIIRTREGRDVSLLRSSLDEKTVGHRSAGRIAWRFSPELLPVSRALWLVAASVPLDVYGPGPLESLLGDLDGVGRVAVTHEAVVEHFALRSGLTVIP